MNEATYKLTIEDAETLISFIKMHEREEISEETWDVCMKLQDFVDDERLNRYHNEWDRLLNQLTDKESD